jgi:hypothetical protein
MEYIFAVLTMSGLSGTLSSQENPKKGGFDDSQAKK